MENKHQIAEWFKGLQDRICSRLEEGDGVGKFQEDAWERPGGGGGRTRIIQNGDVIVKGGVAFSAVHGKTPTKILQALNLPESDFFATGVSIVLHPRSPQVPIIHMNVRYFEMSNGTYWFGGGIDLTPHYVDPEEARYFHQRLKDICDHHNSEYYQKFKSWADDYFYIQHRKETRGIGGIFFDHLREGEGMSKEQIWKFVQEVGEQFPHIYVDVFNKKRDLPYGERELAWQALRRGRYVEFNLVLDKGTKFGLDTDGRTESILMSMPPSASWEYMHSPDPDSKEQQTLNALVKDMDWLATEKV